MHSVNFSMRMGNIRTNSEYILSLTFNNLRGYMYWVNFSMRMENIRSNSEYIQSLTLYN